MSYKHLAIKERNKIEVLSEEGYSSRKISIILGYHHSTIARELNSKKGRLLKITKELEEKIISKLEEKWSLEQIVGRLFKGSLSFKTIYNWLYRCSNENSNGLLRAYYPKKTDLSKIPHSE